MSPEVERLWLSHVKEARPVYRHGWRIATLIVALPVTGAIGWVLLDLDAGATTANCCAAIIGAAVPGIAATAAAAVADPDRARVADDGGRRRRGARRGSCCRSSGIEQQLGRARRSARRCVVVVGAGAVVPLVAQLSSRSQGDARANRDRQGQPAVRSMWGLRPVALQPKGMVFTFVDLGPRLITVTHHDSVAGPYHRNGQQIADVMNVWRGSADAGAPLIAKYHSNYVLSCPNSSTTTIFMAETPKGFYAQLQRGQVPSWLAPVAAAQGFAVQDVEGGRLSRGRAGSSASGRRSRTGRQAPRGSRRGCG